ncbi:GNAT family N-acetyltransferase [Mesorhizobium helmanticense]|uniref:GNAT family N-acetyltransferase n=1 Tax=Mesorhizobium helmanticense TaxID=1776423 RepID=UPI001FE223BB|nr:GNAT family N-acetyltransferase [Mesorhizobium helmanticense]
MRRRGRDSKRFDSDAKIILLNQLYVHPDCQRRGIGQALLEEVEASFPEARTLRVEVEEANAPAVAFYRAQGFLPAGNTADCGGGSGLPALIFEKVIG